MSEDRTGNWKIVTPPAVGELDDNGERIDYPGELGGFSASYVPPASGPVTVRGDAYIHLAPPDVTAPGATMGAAFDLCMADSWRRWAAFASHWYVHAHHDWAKWASETKIERQKERAERMATRLCSRFVGRIMFITQIVDGADQSLALRGISLAIQAIADKSSRIALSGGVTYGVCCSRLKPNRELGLSMPVAQSADDLRDGVVTADAFIEWARSVLDHPAASSVA